MAKPAKRSDCLLRKSEAKPSGLPISKSARLFSRGTAEVYRTRGSTPSA